MPYILILYNSIFCTLIDDIQEVVIEYYNIHFFIFERFANRVVHIITYEAASTLDCGELHVTPPLIFTFDFMKFNLKN